MKLGSLFSGIGGLELGLERALGATTVWQVEQDPYCLQVLEKHWPSARRYTDVRNVGAANLEPITLLSGGFPCQDLSGAGRGEGLSGARSGLWYEMLRITDELRPRWLVIENVNTRRRWLLSILRDLTSIGYDAEWQTVSAADVGAPHLRRRCFVIAYPNGKQLRQQPGRRAGQDGQEETQPEQHGKERPVADPDRQRQLQQEGLEPEERRRDSNSSGEARGEDVAHTHGRRHPAAGEPRIGGCAAQDGERQADIAKSVGKLNVWGVEPELGRVAYGIPRRVDRLRCLGNAVVPQVAELIGLRIKHLSTCSAQQQEKR